MLFDTTTSGSFTNEILSRVFHVRAGVEVIRDRSGKDRPGGKPQETNWRQADVINQVFYSHEKRQWFRRWGGRLVLLRDTRLERMKPMTSVLEHTSPRCLCSERQGRNRTRLNLDIHQTQILNTFLLLRDYCVTKCTCTFQSIKLNSSSDFCIWAVFLLLFLNCFEKSHVSLIKRHFPSCFECVPGCRASCVCCRSVHQGRFVLRESHAWKQEDTQQPQFHFHNLLVGNKASCFCLDIRDPCAAFLQGPVATLLWSLIYIVFSFYNIPSGRPRIFCVVRRKKDGQWQIEGKHWSNRCSLGHLLITYSSIIK